MPGSNGVIALVLLAGAGGMLAALDRTWQAVVLALGTGLGGIVVEATLVKLAETQRRAQGILDSRLLGVVRLRAPPPLPVRPTSTGVHSCADGGTCTQGVCR